MNIPRQQCLTVALLLLSLAAMLLALALSGCATGKAESRKQKVELPPTPPGMAFKKAVAPRSPLPADSARVAPPAPVDTNTVTLAWDLTAYADRTGLDASNDLQTWQTIADYPVTINGVVRQQYTNTVSFTNYVQSWRVWTR